MKQRFFNYIYKIGRFIKKNDTKILTVLGCLGVVATGLTANTAGMKWQELNDKFMYPDDLKRKKGIKIYTLPVLTALATMGCVVGSEGLNLKRISETAAAYALMDKTYKTYRMKNIELNGEKADKEITDAMASTMVSGADVIYYDSEFDRSNDDIDYTDSGIKLFLDTRNNVFFSTTFSVFQDARYHLNRNFALRGEATLNEFYEFLGVNIREEETVGWSWDMMIDMYEEPWIDIRLTRKYDKTGIEYYEIGFPVEPAEPYDM